MKTKIICAFALLVIFTACNKNDSEGPILEDVEPTGTISLKTSLKDVVEVTTTGKAPTLEEVLENLNVHILDNSSGNTFFLTAYSELPEVIELPVGTYNVVFYPSNDSAARFDIARYGSDLGIIDFEISEDVEENINVVLRLWDAVFTVDFDDDILRSFPDIKAAITNSTNSLEWFAVDDLRSGYFLLNEYLPENLELISLADEFTLRISATDDDGNEILVEKVYSPVLANRHFKIKVSSSPTSTVDFDITLGEEEVIEDEITFPN